MNKKKKEIGKVLRKLTAAIAAAGLFAVSIFAFPAEARADSDWPEAPELQSQGAVVLEMNTGVVLYEKNPHQQFYPASITKIMTSLLGIENCSLDETVTFSADAVYNNEGSTSNIARDLGEEMTVEETLYAIMLESANECAWAMAEHVAAKSGGTVTDFVDMMNERAEEIGCTDTNFHNPNGLPDSEHVTSAMDMALIAAEAYKNETFRTITGTKQYTIPPTNKHKDSTPLNNHHKCLNYYKTREYLNPYVTGGKTGYTSAANATLVTYAEKDGMAICVVVMNVDDPLQFSETNELIDYAFSNFTLCDAQAMQDATVSNNDGSYGLLNDNAGVLSFTEDSLLLLPNTLSMADLTAEAVENTSSDGAIRVNYTYDGQVLGSGGILVTDASVSGTVYGTALSDRKVFPLRYVAYGIAGLLFVILLFLIRLIYVRISRKKMRDEKWDARPTPQTLHKTALDRVIREREAAREAELGRAGDDPQEQESEESEEKGSGDER